MSHGKGTILDIGVGSISRSAGRGNALASYHNTLRGKNWSGGTPYIEQASDRIGLIFAARTDMNLSAENLKGHRQFQSLIGDNPISAGRAIAAILDPRASRSEPSEEGGLVRPTNCPLINPYYGFNPLVDNTILSCVGWPNNVVNVTPTAPNEKGASTLLVEGKFKNGRSFDLTIEHTNMDGDMISQMYAILTRYPTLVRYDDIQMYMDNIVLDRADYKSRLYRFVLDPTGLIVDQFTMTGEAFAVSDSTGTAMNYVSETANNDGYETISAQWKCGGYLHNDPIVIDEFNRTQVMHNPDMADGVREKVLYRIGADENLPSLAVSSPYNYFGYPRINPLTLEFEIWVEDLVKNILGSFRTSDEFISAMVKKNNDDLSLGLREYDQEIMAGLTGLAEDTDNTSGTV